MMSAASPSFLAAWYSPSAATIFARPLHVVGKHDVFNLDRRHLRAPRLGVSRSSRARRARQPAYRTLSAPGTALGLSDRPFCSGGEQSVRMRPLLYRGAEPARGDQNMKGGRSSMTTKFMRRSPISKPDYPISRWSTISDHWAALLAWTSFSAHALART